MTVTPTTPFDSDEPVGSAARARARNAWAFAQATAAAKADVPNSAGYASQLPFIENGKQKGTFQPPTGG